MKVLTRTLLMILLITASSYAQQQLDPPPDGSVIRAISFEPQPSTRSLTEILELQVGDQFSSSALRNSIRNLIRLGVYSDVKVVWSAVGDGIALVFKIEEIPEIEGITIIGNGPVSKSKILSAAKLDIDFRYDNSREGHIVHSISELYRTEGYYAAEVNILSMINLETGGVRLEIAIDHGDETKLGKINIIGYPVYELGDILSAVKATNPGSRFIEKKFRDDIPKILQFYHDNGYLTADVGVANIVYNSSNNSIVANLLINAGPIVRISFDPQISNAGTLLSSIPFSDRNVPVDGILANGQERIVSELNQDGFINSTVDISYEIIPEESIVQVIVSIDKGENVRSGGVEIEGLEPDIVDSLLPQLSLVKQGWFSRPVYNESKAQEDIKRIRQRLAELGYYTPQINSIFREDGEKNITTLELTVDKGEQSVISNIAIIGNDSFEPSVLLAQLGLEPGNPFISKELSASVERLRDFYDLNGFAETEITVNTRNNNANVSLEFAIDEGRRSRIKKIIVSGNMITRESVIRDTLLIAEGDPYSQDRIVESRRALNRMGIFDRVDIQTLADDTNPSDKRLVVSVSEIRPYSLRYGIGVDSEEKFRFSFGFSNSNIYGRQIEAGFNTRVSQIEQRYQTYFRSPRMFGFLRENTVRLFYEELERPGYGVRIKGLVYETSGYQVGGFNIIGQIQQRWIDVFDIKSSVEVNRVDKPVRLSLLSLIFGKDTRDDLVEPRNGYFTNLVLQASQDFFGSDYGYFKGDIRHFGFKSITPWLVVAYGFHTGAALPYNDLDLIPISERFFLGGSNSLRGFELDGVGPEYLGDDGELYPLGGNAIINGNLELRFPLMANIGGVVFTGFGNVFKEASDFDLGNLEYMIGAGIRYSTPFGPVRLDYGTSLTTDDNQIYFTVGHAF